jgi:CRP/FNR family transcriptional regulator, cyclic AMP receptor protein
MQNAGSAALGQIALFEGATADELAALSGVLRRRSCPPRTSIIASGQPGEVVYIVWSGTVKVHTTHPDGGEVIIAILRCGEVVGEMSILDALGRSADVTTTEESTLLWVDRAKFWSILETMPRITYNLVRILSRRLRLANARIEALATLDVSGRVARELLSLAREYGEPSPGGTVIPFHLSQSEVAGLTGATRVRVNQVLTAFKRRRYIATDESAHIVVCDERALERQCR